MTRQQKRGVESGLLYMYSEQLDTDAARNVGFFGYVIVLSAIVAAAAGTAVYMTLTVIFQIFAMYVYTEYPSTIETHLVLNPIREALGIATAAASVLVMVISQSAKWNKLVTRFEEREYRDESRLTFNESPLMRAEVIENRNATSRTIKFSAYEFTESEWKRLGEHLQRAGWYFGPREEVAKVRNDSGGVLFANITANWMRIQRELIKSGVIDNRGFVTEEGREWFMKLLPHPARSNYPLSATTSGNGRTTADDEGQNGGGE